MQSTNTSHTCPYLILIDLDHCPQKIREVEELIKFSRVLICHGSAEPKIHLGLLGLLAEAMTQGRLEIVAVDGKEKNAAEYGITFWVGKLQVEMSPQTEFFLISKNKQLDLVVQLLREAGRKVRRIDGSENEAQVIRPDEFQLKGEKKRQHGNFAPASKEGEELQHMASQHIPAQYSSSSHCLPQAVSSETVSPIPMVRSSRSLQEAVTNFCLTCLKDGRSRPRKRTTLLHTIESFCRNWPGILSGDILHDLENLGILECDINGKVIYLQEVTTLFGDMGDARKAEVPF